jgi:hypothetical protein
MHGFADRCRAAVRISFAPIIPVGAGASDAVVQFDAAVRHGHRIPFKDAETRSPKSFPESPIEPQRQRNKSSDQREPKQKSDGQALPAWLWETDPKVESTSNRVGDGRKQMAGQGARPHVRLCR